MSYCQRDKAVLSLLFLELWSPRYVEERCFKLLDDVVRRLWRNSNAAVNTLYHIDTLFLERWCIREPGKSLFRGKAKDPNLVSVPREVIGGPEDGNNMAAQEGGHLRCSAGEGDVGELGSGKLLKSERCHVVPREGP